jgi:hypothetical protein
MAIQLWPLAVSRIAQGSKAVIAAYGPCLGGTIWNPATARDQQIGTVEMLYVDIVGPAATSETATTIPIQPGQSYTIPNGFTGMVSVNAVTSGHSFSGVILQPPSDSVTPEQPGIGETDQPFPPLVSGVATGPLKSYLYQQYSDDDDLQAFVSAFNEMQTQYYEWFAHLNPADYTQAHIQGALLDWVALGLYGMARPWLPVGHGSTIGPLNTYAMNTWILNRFAILPPAEFFLTDDDIFKRVLTWHLYKADGDVFNIRWLKRRIERFLTGTDGTGGETHAVDPWLAPDQTYEVSVTFGVGNIVNINFQTIRRRFIGGALLNTFMLNTRTLNEFDTTSVTFPAVPLAPIFKAAVESGALELPFQFEFTVNL